MTTHRWRFYVLQTLDRRYATVRTPGIPALTSNFELANTYETRELAAFVREAFEEHLSITTGEPISLAIREVNRVLPGG
jgi:hypothetical protein